MFFSSLADNGYDVYTATDDWVNGAWYDSELWTDHHSTGSIVMYNPAEDWRQFTFPNGTQGRRACHFNGSDNFRYFTNTCSYQTAPGRLQDYLSADSSRYERLDAAECIQAYAKNFLPQRSNVILTGEVVDETTVYHAKLGIMISLGDPLKQNHPWSSNNTQKWARDVYRNSSLMSIMTGKTPVDYMSSIDRSGLPPWLCRNQSNYNTQTCSTNEINQIKDLAAAGDLILDGLRVTGCASQKTAGKCGMNFNQDIAIVVIVMNLMKGILITLVYFTWRDRPILTIGDAIATFMIDPDATAKDACLASSRHFETDRNPNYTPPPKPYRYYRHRRASLAGASSWFWFLIR
jgi:hypothetical protein